MYYPDSEVYYAPDSRVWFWLDGDDWRSGPVLPMELQAYVRVGGVSIELGDAQPWVEQTYVIQHYGGRRVDWHHHDDRRRHWHDHDDDDQGHRHDHDH